MVITYYLLLITYFIFFFVRFEPGLNITYEVERFYATEISIFTNRIGEVFLIAFEQDEVFDVVFPYEVILSVFFLLMPWRRRYVLGRHCKKPV